jgi:hypothetical protein
VQGVPLPIGELVPAPKTLDQHDRDGTFRARRHRELLAGPVVEWPLLALLQARYAATPHELERRLIGVEFERAMRELDSDDNEREAREGAERELRELLDAEPVDVDPDKDAANSDRSMRAVWCRDLRQRGLSYRAIGEEVGASGPQVRRMLLGL